MNKFSLPAVIVRPTTPKLFNGKVNFINEKKKKKKKERKKEEEAQFE